MNFLDRTNHNHLAEQTNRRLAAASIADRYIPAVDRQVERTDNAPPELVEVEPVPDDLLINGSRWAPSIDAYAGAVMASNPAIESATAQAELLKAFIADNPVIQTGAEAQKAATWIESTRKTLAAMEDERKPKTIALNAALASINGPYRPVREMLESLLSVVRTRWNKWDAAERTKREDAARIARLEAEEAARIAQELIDRANDAIACSEVGECADAGTAIVDAEAAMRDANKLDRAANRADKMTNVRVASMLGGRAQTSRKRRVIEIVDPCAAIKAIGLTEKIVIAIQQSAAAFEEAYGELPAGTKATFVRSI